MTVCAASSAFGATFSNVTAAAGISHTVGSGTFFTEIQAGGAAAGDYDNDGWVDLFVTRFDYPDILYRNKGDGTFEDVTTSAFLPSPLNRQTNGAAWGDIDNDGDLDLYVNTIDELRHLLYINNGDGTFEEQAVARGAGVGDGSRATSGSSVSMGDYDNDGYLDIYVTEWRGFEASGSTTDAWARLLRNEGAANPGHFQDVTDAAGVAMDLTSGIQANKSLSFTPRFADLDRDGFQDLAVISDGSTSRIFWNNGNGTFSDGTSTAAINTGTNDMGFTLGDVDGDGLLDWFATSIYKNANPDENPNGNRLFKNHGDRTFTDITSAAGVRNGQWGWGADMFDYDNDGDLDITMTNGFPLDYPSDQVRLWENDGSAVFTEIATSVGMTDTAQGRGLLTFDYDKDGDEDVFIVNYNAQPVLYRNDGGNESNWLRIETTGTVSNRDGAGAFITVIPDLENPDGKMVREISASSNFLSQSEMIAHFGLGSAESVDVVLVEWPTSGYVQRFTDVAANTLLEVEETFCGDYNGDGIVGAGDFTVWRDTLGSTVMLAADGDGNLVIDLNDYEIWKLNIGNVAPSGSGAYSTVPEPASVTLFVLAIWTFAMLGWGRSRPSFLQLVR